MLGLQIEPTLGWIIMLCQ